MMASLVMVIIGSSIHMISERQVTTFQLVYSISDTSTFILNFYN